jgi:hypothetical protein
MPLDSRLWYAEDHAAIRAAYANVADYCRAHGLSYVYWTSGDLERETDDDDRLAVQRLIAENSGLQKVFAYGVGAVYRVKEVPREDVKNR